MAKNKLQLLESTGYSWSGIADVIHNSPSKTKQLLHEIDEAYNTAKQRQEELEAELKEVKSQHSYCVSSFVHVYNALGLKDKLAFQRGMRAVVITILDFEETRIDYESTELQYLDNV